MDWIDDFIEMLFSLDSSKQNMEGAFLLKYQNLPTKIFKYREVNENSIKNLEENTIWLADPTTLNDPYECHHFIDHGEFAYSQLKENPELRQFIKSKMSGRIPDHVIDSLNDRNDPIRNFIKNLEPTKSEADVDAVETALISAFRNVMEGSHDPVAKGLKEGFVLCSFSERVDSTLMWAHYAKYHTGFCVEYDVKSVPGDNFFSRFLYPVKYSDTPFNATENLKRVGTNEFNSLYLNLAGLIKARDWAYEREWRLLFANGVAKGPHTYKVATPTAVYFGSHITDKNQGDISEICRKKGIPIKKMEHSRSEFKMASIDIT